MAGFQITSSNIMYRVSGICLNQRLCDSGALGIKNALTASSALMPRHREKLFLVVMLTNNRKLTPWICIY